MPAQQVCGTAGATPTIRLTAARPKSWKPRAKFNSTFTRRSKKFSTSKSTSTCCERRLTTNPIRSKSRKHDSRHEVTGQTWSFVAITHTSGWWRKSVKSRIPSLICTVSCKRPRLSTRTYSSPSRTSRAISKTRSTLCLSIGRSAWAFVARSRSTTQLNIKAPGIRIQAH